MAELNDLLDLLLKEEPEDGQQTEESTEEVLESEPEVSEVSEEPEAQEAGLNLGEIFSLLDTYKEVVGEIKNDDRAQLIKAIKPFLSDARQTKADNCLKFLSITRFMEHKEEFSKLGGKFLPV